MVFGYTRVAADESGGFSDFHDNDHHQQDCDECRTRINLCPLPANASLEETREWHKVRANKLFRWPEPNDHDLQLQHDVLQAMPHAPLNCSILTNYMGYAHVPTREQVESHARHLACHALTDFASLGVPHVFGVRHKRVEAIVRKFLDVPPHVEFRPLGDVAAPFAFHHTTMKIDDDDVVSLDYVRHCCSARATDVVMYPARPYLYFEDLDIVHHTNFKFHTFGLCMFPNRYGLSALGAKHNHVHELEGIRVALAHATGFYTRHSGNDSPGDKFSPDPTRDGYRENVVLRPQCKDFRLPPGFVDELLAVLS